MNRLVLCCHGSIRPITHGMMIKGWGSEFILNIVLFSSEAVANLI